MSLWEMVKKLRSGEKVICPVCNSGKLMPVNNTDYKTTHCFECNNCKETLNID